MIFLCFQVLAALSMISCLSIAGFLVKFRRNKLIMVRFYRGCNFVVYIPI